MKANLDKTMHKSKEKEKCNLSRWRTNELRRFFIRITLSEISRGKLKKPLEQKWLTITANPNVSYIILKVY